MNPASTHFVLCYHGCDWSVAERVFAGQDVVTRSNNEWDWLGEGAYFWEANAQRAHDYAVELMNRPRTGSQRITHPAVVGAVIDLAFCLNLLDSRFVSVVRDAYDRLVQMSEEAGMELPKNTGGQDLLRRNLDCAVMRTLHQLRADAGDVPFDTVRAAFTEGDLIYPTAGSPPRFTSKSASASRHVSKGTSARSIPRVSRPLLSRERSFHRRLQHRRFGRWRAWSSAPTWSLALAVPSAVVKLISPTEVSGGSGSGRPSPAS